MQKIKEKMVNMTPKQKMEYIVEYYGIYILFISVGVLLVILFAIHVIQKKEYALNILPLNADGKNIQATGTDFFKDFLENQEIDPNRNMVGVNYTIYLDTESDEAINQEGLQMMQTLFMAQAVDVVLADETSFENIAADGYFARLQDYLPDEVIQQYKLCTISARNEETGQLMDVGIKVKNEGLLADTGWYSTPYVCIGLADNISHQRLAVQFLMEILKH